MKSLFKKNSFFSKRYLYTLYILPWLLAGIYFLITYKSPYYIIYPETKDNIQEIGLITYTDSIHNGNSIIKILKNSKNEMSYQYTIGSKYKYPFTITSYYAKKGMFFDLSKYDYLKVKIKAKHGIRISASLWTHIENYSNADIGTSYMPSQYIINVSKEFKEVNIPFNELYTPDWWYSENKKKVADLSRPNLAKVESINFTNCINLKPNIEDTVTISEISFHVNLFPYLLNMGVFSLIFYSILIGFTHWQKRSKTSKIKFNYETFDTSSSLTENESIIFNYITTHYHLSDLSIPQVEQATQLSERTISSVIKAKTTLNFKQFLNRLRISEAQRLLLESDSTIAEIAFKVGYANVSHFNRVFKTIEDISPNEFRKKQAVN